METAIDEKLGISITQKFYGVMETFVKHGIKYLEFRIIHGNDRALIKRNVDITLSEKEKSGMLTPTIHLPHIDCFDLSDTNTEKRKKAIANQKEMIWACMPLNPRIAVVHPSVGVVGGNEAGDRKKALIKSLREFCPWCADRGIRVAIENLTSVSMVQTSEDLLEIIDAVENNTGICFDVNHLLTQSLSDFIKKAGKHIITMHVSDNDGIAERHFMPGDGVINWKELFFELGKINYDSTMIVECGQVLQGFPETVDILCEKWKSIH
jgi:sugar phosphate isomerase/epimerase